ncbi:MAG TPA: ATP-binding protein [Spongiibacteraceae bacterium]|nr:ATP-binding protein [Spongiibacteraceae bacterium]
MPNDKCLTGAEGLSTPMVSQRKLPASALCRTCDVSQLPDLIVDETATLQPLGQQRATEALQFGIGIRRRGYNIVMFGSHGSGRHTMAYEQLQRQAATEPTPPDWCYVHNFAHPRNPRALLLPSGRGELLRTAMRGLVEELLAALPSAFERDEYRGRRNTLDDELKKKHEDAFGELARQAEEKNIALMRTPVGFTLLPTRKSEPMRPDQLQHLPEAERTRIQEDLESLEVQLKQILQQIPDWEREHRDALRALIRETAANVIERLIAEVARHFEDIPAAIDYLRDVEHDIHDHVDEFLAAGKARSEQTMPGKLESDDGTFTVFRRYRVNIMVNHAQNNGAPVIYEDHPTYQRLLGRVEHIAQEGMLLTDFNLIVPGALHRANGGYLVVDADRILMNAFSWDALKRALRAEQIRIESIEELLSIGTTTLLDPEAIALELTVVLIASPLIYFLLSSLDPDVNELFKIAAELEPDVERTADSERDYALLLAAIARRDKLRPLDKAAVARVIEYAARLSDDAQRLSTSIATIVDLLREADFCASRNGRADTKQDTITRDDVQQAIDLRIRRADRIPRRLQEEIANKTLRIETSGVNTGQINGLSVFSLGGVYFGQANRITARVRLGRGEVIDIERQVHLGGPLHSKGVMILSGFLGGRFGRNCKLSLVASLVFEQSYGGIEGDSASAAELFALMSAVADIPLKQSIAVTGSVDQRGQIQAIGGVNEKIEGFFDACKTQGFSGEQGVIIPAANARQLMLRRDVVEAAEAGQFHIYAIDNIDEGMEILTGLRAGEQDSKGNYPEGSINCLIARQLAEFAEKSDDKKGENSLLHVEK